MGRHSLLATIIFALVTLAATGTAEANGTLRVTFKFFDTNGIAQPLPYTYLYLRDSSPPPSIEKHFTPADYIFDPANSSEKNTTISPLIP